MRVNIFAERFTAAISAIPHNNYPFQKNWILIIFFLPGGEIPRIKCRSTFYLAAARNHHLFLIGSWRVAQSGGVTSGENQSTGQLGLRLRRVLILFEDNRAGISRLCPIAEDPAGVAVLLELVRTRVPNRQWIRIIRKDSTESSSTETTDQSTSEELPKERLPLQGLRCALTRYEDSAPVECDRSFGN